MVELLFDGLVEHVNRGLRLHSNQAHNYYVGRRLPCPYCLLGFDVVPKVVIVERLRELKRI